MECSVVSPTDNFKPKIVWNDIWQNQLGSQPSECHVRVFISLSNPSEASPVRVQLADFYISDKLILKFSATKSSFAPSIFMHIAWRRRKFLLGYFPWTHYKLRQKISWSFSDKDININQADHKLFMFMESPLIHFYLTDSSW